FDVLGRVPGDLGRPRCSAIDTCARPFQHVKVSRAYVVSRPYQGDELLPVNAGRSGETASLLRDQRETVVQHVACKLCPHSGSERAHMHERPRERFEHWPRIREDLVAATDTR